MTRYYIKWSSIFDCPDNHYNIDLFTKTIKAAGAINVRKSNQFGWCNQPTVVTFSIISDQLRTITKALQKLPVFKKWGPIIFEKDW